MSANRNWHGQVPVQNPDLAWRLVDDECIIVDPQSSQATVLNPVGARIWDLMDGKRTIAAIVDEVVAEYTVGREQAEADAREFFEELGKRRLVQFQAEPEAHA